MNSFIKIGSFLLCLSLFLSCEKEGKVQEENQSKIKTLDTLTIPRLKGLKPELTVLPDAQKELISWKLYQDIAPYIDSLSATSGSKITTYITKLEKAFAFKGEIENKRVNPTPEKFRGPALKARMLALETKIKALKNATNTQKPEGERIAASIVGIKNAWQDLNLQIDELFNLSIDELIKAANEEPDSLFYKPKEVIIDSSQTTN